jgi:sec1 family domain-containing protein 1
LRVQDLRDVGVTLHVQVVYTFLRVKTRLTLLLFARQLHSNRPPLPDVPAIYFVSPTVENIKRVAEDLDKALYESVHLSFVEPLPRMMLEELATQVAQDGTGDSVKQVNNTSIEILRSDITPDRFWINFSPL